MKTEDTKGVIRNSESENCITIKKIKKKQKPKQTDITQKTNDRAIRTQIKTRSEFRYCGSASSPNENPQNIKYIRKELS
jgi:hypothetical protein